MLMSVTIRTEQNYLNKGHSNLFNEIGPIIVKEEDEMIAILSVHDALTPLVH